MSDEKSTEAVEYRPIEGFPGYRVGDDGSVWSCLQKFGRGIGGGRGTLSRLGDEWRQLKTTINNCGYRTVRLACVDGYSQRHVHSLVLESFTGCRPDGLIARHMNGKPSDSRLVNLQYGTVKQNAEDARLHGILVIGSRQGGAKLTESQVYEMRVRHKAGETNRELAVQFGVRHSTVKSVVSGRSWKHVEMQ